MIAVSEALKRIENVVKQGKIKRKSLKNAFGLILAEDVYTPINMPPFRQSSMDGYAIMRYEGSTYDLVDEVQAGVASDIALKPGQAVRIFTGARVPDAADTVVIQEHVIKNGNSITIEKLPALSANIRPVGEQVKKGDLVLEKGSHLNEAAIGFLAGLGISKIDVFTAPKVGLLVTGDELQQAGKPLEEGQIYESNSITLKLALKRAGIFKIKPKRVKDQLEATTKAIKKQLETCDILLISGGISVGDYDFVQEALEKNKVEEVFYKINQKPGKPLWFGKKGDQLVFALPGNPASSLTCFYVYVWPALRKMMGYPKDGYFQEKAILHQEVKNPFGKSLFLKGKVVDGKASTLSGQASSMLKSFAVSNALIVVPEDRQVMDAGESVSYISINKF